jgi:hypothetical protein
MAIGLGAVSSIGLRRSSCQNWRSRRRLVREIGARFGLATSRRKDQLERRRQHLDPDRQAGDDIAVGLDRLIRRQPLSRRGRTPRNSASATNRPP